jgi:hypothetical protein
VRVAIGAPMRRIFAASNPAAHTLVARKNTSAL